MHAKKIRVTFAAAACFTALSAPAQSSQITLHVRVAARQHAKMPMTSSGNVVVWLSPEQRLALPLNKNTQYSLVQKDKQFRPHILVVPTGSSVSFPNLDPFFHNVFSLFNGKRFDLGLYEAHSQRSVLFDREGISYIFCNIHPEMGAVVIAVNTPYYAISSPDGGVSLHEVPPGRYQLHLWAENVPAAGLEALTRAVEIAGPKMDLGEIMLQSTGDMTKHHQNKFGANYPPQNKDSY